MAYDGRRETRERRNGRRKNGRPRRNARVDLGHLGPRGYSIYISALAIFSSRVPLHESARERERETRRTTESRIPTFLPRTTFLPGRYEDKAWLAPARINRRTSPTSSYPRARLANKRVRIRGYLKGLFFDGSAEQTRACMRRVRRVDIPSRPPPILRYSRWFVESRNTRIFLGGSNTFARVIVYPPMSRSALIKHQRADISKSENYTTFAPFFPSLFDHPCRSIPRLECFLRRNLARFLDVCSNERERAREGEREISEIAETR